MQARFRFTAFAAAAFVIGCGSNAIAATPHNGWHYAIDDMTDGSGGSGYEYRGLAYKLTRKKLKIAISSGMALGGTAAGGSLNGGQANGEMFFNFSAHNLDTIAEHNDPLVLGVRFDAGNDSLGNVGGSNTTLGLFKEMTVGSLAGVNSGYASYASYVGAGFGRATDAMADLEDSNGDVIAYLGNGAIPGNMISGTKIANIALHNKAALTAMGVDFGHFGADPGGNHVYGFSVGRKHLPTGDFTAHMLQECINDGMAIKGSVPPNQNVPEPGSVAMIVAGVLTGGAVLFRRRRA